MSRVNCILWVLCAAFAATPVRAEEEPIHRETEGRSVAPQLTQQQIDEALSTCGVERGTGETFDPLDLFGALPIFKAKPVPRTPETTPEAIIDQTCRKCHRDIDIKLSSYQFLDSAIAMVRSGRMPKPDYPFEAGEKEILLDFLEKLD